MGQLSLLDANEKIQLEDYYSIRTKTPETVKAISNEESFIEIDGLNIFEDRLKVGQVIFIVFGGDKAKKK